MSTQKDPNNSIIVDVDLQGRLSDETLPDIALYLIGPTGTPTEKLAVVREGKLELEEEWRRRGLVIAFGPDVEDLQQLRKELLLQHRIEEVWPEWRRRDLIEIPRAYWPGWLWKRVCVSGRVEVCSWGFWPTIPDLPEDLLNVGLPGLPGLPGFPGGGSQPAQPLIGMPVIPEFTINPIINCRPLCDGVVEIFERLCCCHPWTVLDPRLEELIRKLKEVVGPIPWPPPPPVGPPRPQPDPLPPGPGPDPAPNNRAMLRQLKLGEALTDRSVAPKLPQRLAQDLRVIESLPRAVASEYIYARSYLPHLLCTCSVRKVGEAVIGPDGSFTFCYWQPGSLTAVGSNCTTTWVYRVRQWQENQWVEVYDGFSAHEYFNADEFAVLTSYDPRARPCGEPEPPPVINENDLPFVMLQEIGSTDSHHLVSPAQNGVDGINSPLADNGGLVFPPTNRPWSMTLPFRLYVHPDMEALGAHYYRISIVAADSQGNPAGGATPAPLAQPVSWRRFVSVGGSIQVQGESLGPNAVTDSNGVNQAGLYVIPYWDASHQWLHGQFHHTWNTLAEANGRSVVTVEIFNHSGDRLRPSGGGGAGIDTNFNFLHWTTPTTTTSVPFASLAHVFWTDKQPCYGDIEDLRINGVKNTEDCQFMEGPGGNSFSIGFRAFHVNGPSGETFMQSYSIWYHRGLNGPNTPLDSGTINAPPSLGAGLPAESDSETFADMLAGVVPPKCAFAVNLGVLAKHWNGSGRIHAYDRYDQAAFAVEIV